MTETTIRKKIQVALTHFGARLWRNNVGVLQDKNGMYVAFGLCVGSADLIGYCPVLVGTRWVPVFLAVEVKTPTGRATPEQISYLKSVRKHGGFAFIARSEAEALDLLRGQIAEGSRI